MGHMKELLITVHNGGDDAVAAVQRIGEDWRLQLEAAASEIERLRRWGCLTRGERQAIEFCIGAHPLDDSIPATLRSLLERLN